MCIVFANTLSTECPVNFPFYFIIETIPSDTAREFCVCVCVCVCNGMCVCLSTVTSPNEDFIPIGEDPGTGLYQFQRCERDKVCAEIAIIDDNILEGNEFFTFNLSVKTNGNNIAFAADQRTELYTSMIQVCPHKT